MSTVILETSSGNMTIKLNHDDAPISVENFLSYVDTGFYNNTIFHRVIPGFMIQGGGMNKDMTEKETREPIKNEAQNGLKNTRGTLAMARTQVVDSATSQFFINLADNAFLDNGDRDFGYAVFAEVIEGMDIVEEIGKAPTGNKGMMADVPNETITILTIRRTD
ncbi:MAG: peptidyl-prolyl cis-trans isomerase [Gammaproteobacteria bacterium]|nr:peptidyl-prolyl cis-trans isomerase [Gammaproteobacteria bacterium]